MIGIEEAKRVVLIQKDNLVIDYKNLVAEMKPSQQDKRCVEEGKLAINGININRNSSGEN